MSRLRRTLLTASAGALLVAVSAAISATTAVPAAGAEEEAGQQAACDYPADVLNLTNWKITLPVDNPNQSGTQPLEVKQPALDSYRLSPWFVANSDCAGVRFRNAVNGAHTPNSSYARSELREMTNNGSANASWSSTSGTHTMTVDQAITHLPNDKPHVVAGQIHDGEDDVMVFRLEGSSLYLTNGDDTHYKLITSNYQLGTRFQAKFVVSDGQIKAYYNGTLQATLNKEFSGAYFKAGAYTQANCDNSDPCDTSNYGEVIVHNVTVTHGSGDPDPEPPIGDPLRVCAVTASGDDGNVPANTIDGNLATRWSAEGDGVWIRYDLCGPVSVGSIGLAWHQGDQRRASFTVHTSTDGTTWSTALSTRNSSGASLQQEQHDLTDRTARYVRVTGHGNPVNDWTSITEADVYAP